MQLETRTFELEILEVRASTSGRTLEGLASVFDSESKDIGFVETISPGAFKASLAGDLIKDPVFLFWQHDAAKPLASTKGNSLELKETDKGLWFRATLNSTTWSDDAIAAIRAGDITQMSFGFQTLEDEWSADKKKRRLKRVKLYEISAVSTPAYTASSVTAVRRKNKVPTNNSTYTAQGASPEFRRVEVGDDRRTLEPFNSFGEQMLAVYRAQHPAYGDIDPRLLNPEIRGDDPTGASEKVPADGGFLVQKDFSDEILSNAHSAANIASRCRNIPVSGNGLKNNAIDETSRVEGSRWGGVQSFWKDEAGTFEASRPKFRQIELILNKLTAVFYATDEVLQDATALGAIASQAFGEDLAFKIDNEIIAGAGTGRPLGILNAGCLVEVSKEGGQTATTFVYENALNMYARMDLRSLANAAWFINQDVYPQLFQMSLAVGTGGGPVFLPPGGASVAPYGTLLGKPVVPIEQCKTLGTVGDVILADFSQYLLINKGGVKADSSIHVRFLNDEVTFRYITRVDGCPWMRSALTPANGTNTVSPFVVLETRS